MAFVVDRIDHVVLNCRDVDTTTDWYVQVLGMRREVFGEGRIALVFGNQKINVLPPARRTGRPARSTPPDRSTCASSPTSAQTKSANTCVPAACRSPPVRSPRPARSVR